MRNLLARAEAVGRASLGLLLLAMVLLNVGNAAGRYLFARALPGADELLLFAMIWLVFFGLVLVTLQRRHLRLDLLERILPGRGRLVLQIFSDLLLALLAGFLALQSFSAVERLAMIGQSSMALALPMDWVHGGLLVGLALTCLIALLQGAAGLWQLFDYESSA